MREQNGDKDPKDGAHGTPAGIGKDKSEAKQPGGEQDAEEQASGTIQGYCPQ
jgi:hypothetical protein